MVKSIFHPRRKRSKFLAEVALFCLAGGFAGIVACGASLVIDALFDLFAQFPGYPWYRSLEGWRRKCGTQALSVGMVLGAFHGVIWQHRWINRQVGRSILFWAVCAAVTPCLSVLLGFFAIDEPG